MRRDFDTIAKSFGGRDGVETGRMFGALGLKVGGKVFAMEVKGELVVKLTTARSNSLVQSGEASFFDPGHGRPMKQWVSVAPSSTADWHGLADEAFDLAVGAPGGS